MTINGAINTYKELYFNHVNKAQQPTITDYLSRLQPSPPPPTSSSNSAPMDVEIEDDELDAILRDDSEVTPNFSGFGEVAGGDGSDDDSSASQ